MEWYSVYGPESDARLIRARGVRKATTNWCAFNFKYIDSDSTAKTGGLGQCANRTRIVASRHGSRFRTFRYLMGQAAGEV